MAEADTAYVFSMTCPKCKNTKLEPVELLDFTVDRCPECQGVWFDSGPEGGELAKVIGLGFSQLPAELKESFTPGPAVPPEHAVGDLRCPRPDCDAMLASHWYLSEPDTFIVDDCPAGHGVWLDDAELKNAYDLVKKCDKALERLVMKRP